MTGSAWKKFLESIAPLCPLSVGGLMVLLSCARSSPSRDFGTPLDSTGAVRAAEAKLRPAELLSLRYRVTRFERLTYSYLIELMPEPPGENIEIMGGGGLVLVRFDGAAEVLRIDR